MASFRHDGLDFYYEEHGVGFPFIFSHGLRGNSERVRDQLRFLPDVRVLLYDNRGHGRTRPLGDPRRLNFEDMAEDMAALADYLGIDSACVGGVSMGAGIALACALRHRTRVRALVLSRPAWLDAPFPPNLAHTQAIAGLIEKFGLERARQEFEKTDYFQDMARHCPEAVKSMQEIFLDQDPQALVACFRHIPASVPVDSLSRLRELEAPALVLGCRADPIHPWALAESWAQALPNATLREIPSRLADPSAHDRHFRHNVGEFLKRVLSGKGA
ncbi:MAG: alpha/beta fold hydrolase [Acidobacteriota bacterium]